MCFLELLKKIVNWIVTSASISDECRLITMDQVRIVWIAIQNDKWAKVIFHSCNTIAPNAFNYLNRPRKKFVRLISKKSYVFHHSMAYCASNTILFICIYVYPIYCRKTRKNRLSTFNYRLKYHFFRFFPCNHINEILYTKTVFQLQFYAMEMFFLLFITPDQFFFSVNSQWMYLECQFFTTFFLLSHLIYFVIPLGSSLTDWILGRPLSGHSFSLCLFWSLFVVLLQIFFFSFACMVIFINLFPIHLFETALFFAFICFLNDTDSFFPILIFTLSSFITPKRKR